MPANVITDVLRNDITDRTAANVIAANPPNTFTNNAASAVPAYLYQSLKTIWMGVTGSPVATYQALIVPDLGTGQASPVGSIVVTAQRLIEQVLDKTSLESDAPGAEISPIYILLYKPRATSVSIDLIQNASLRIRYLLDNTLRALRIISPNLPLSSVEKDISIDPRQPFYCFYQSNLEPIAASEATLFYTANYTRLFTK